MSQTLLSILAFVPLVLAGVLLIGFRWPAKYAMPLVFVLTAVIGLLAWDMTLNRVIASTFQGLILTAAILDHLWCDPAAQHAETFRGDQFDSAWLLQRQP